ncbi:hypothetical protein [Amycolatopsis samaneae]|uniref:Uncharacterized protein n=1 Tax=Amycolatopsis samaneae TaxID=664691 RepID=A0ABW5GFH7_9PSEU
MVYRSGPERRDSFFRTSPPRREPEKTSAVEQARQQAERLFGQHGKPPRESEAGSSRLPRPEDTVSSEGLPPLDRLFEHEQARAAARAARDSRLASRALREVAVDLNNLLDLSEEQLRLSARGRARQTVKEAMPQLVARSSLAALPFGEVADLLGLPPGKADEVVDALTRRGGLSPGERYDALKGIEWLREQLRQAKVTEDQSLLDRLVRFIVKIAVLVGVAVGAASLGAFAVEDWAVKGVVKAGIIALVAVALQRVADGVRDRGRGPYAAARAAHDALLDELTAAQALSGPPAYAGEPVVVRVRLAVRIGSARIASLSLDWQEKQQYWAILGEAEEAVGSDRLDALARTLRTLRALTPPERRER